MNGNILKSGMVSVTFRDYSVDRVIGAAIKAGLDGIEWGGDIHVPHGDIEKAAYTAEACHAAGLEIFSYGSYYRAGPGQDFAPVLATASALGAPNIRLWAGNCGSAEIKGEYQAFIADVRSCADLAGACGKTISFEYHSGTVTDNPDSAVDLIGDTDRKNVYLYWQPDQNRSTEYNIAALKKVLPFLLHVHVFTWRGGVRYPLADGSPLWTEAVGIIGSTQNPHGLFLEFSPDNTEESFLTDAATLKKWVNPKKEHTGT